MTRDSWVPHVSLAAFRSKGRTYIRTSIWSKSHESPIKLDASDPSFLAPHRGIRNSAWPQVVVRRPAAAGLAPPAPREEESQEAGRAFRCGLQHR
jgi:hypothetical protein